jgi:uncharacterized protein DUF4190
VLGICGLVFFPLIPSILAIVFGRSARNEIEAQPGLGGGGMATAGIVLGWIGIALVVVGVLLFVLLVAVATSSP